MLKQTQSMLDDEELKQVAIEELQSIKVNLRHQEQQIIQHLVKPQENDQKNVNLQIKQAMGAYRRGWRWKEIDFVKDMSINKGLKTGKFKIQGQFVNGVLKHQRGVHKVQRVPQTQKQGRLHSSSAIVVVMPQVPMNFSINMKDVRVDFYRASGAGGQHVNRTDSACRMTHIPTGIVAQNQDERDQVANKQRALKVLTQRVYSKQLQEQESKIGAERASQRKSGNISDKIRTYNWPNNRITDHRLGVTLYGIDQIFEGQLLEQFIDVAQEQEKKEKLKDLLKI